MFVGLGTGRCGTHSLAEIIESCVNTKCTHEECLLDFNRTNLDLAHEFFGDLEDQERTGLICGDVSLTWTFHIDAIKWIVPDLDVICLHRPKTEFIESWMRWTYSGHNVFGRPFEKSVPPKYFLQYGNGKTSSPEKSDRAYLDAYWDYCESIMKNIPGAHHLYTSELNTKTGIKGIFDYLKIPESDRPEFETISSPSEARSEILEMR